MAAIFAGSEEREIPLVSQMGVYEYTRYVTRLLIAEQTQSEAEPHDAAAASGPEAARRRRPLLTPADKDERETLLRQIGEAY